MLLIYISGDAVGTSCIQTQTIRMKSMTTSINKIYICIEYRV